MDPLDPIEINPVKHSIAFLLWMMLLALTGCQHETYRLEQPAVRGTIAWGQPSHGLQAGLAVTGVGGGDTAVVHTILYLRNVSNSPIKLLDPASYYPDPAGLGSAFEVSENGEPLAKLHKTMQPAPAASAFITIRPGQTITAKRDIDTAYWAPPVISSDSPDIATPAPKLAAPFTIDVTFVYTGRYEVQRQSDVGLSIASGDETGLWTGNVRSAPVTVKVTR